MGDSIFLRTDNGLVVLTETPYASESLLQDALAQYPEVLAGPTTTGEHAGKLLLVRQEKGVPTALGAGASLSLDHLFVDAAGTPILVEVKRSSDTRIRREVIGQLLDYAANGVRHWPAGTLQADFEQTHGPRAQEQMDGIGRGEDPEAFWDEVDANLRAGRVRMVIVADRLPPELIRIIEFLNEQMRDAEILGVQVVQHVGPNGEVAYVPSIVGRTSEAVDTKEMRGAVRPRWTRQSFLDAAAKETSSAAVALLARLIDDATANGGQLKWGAGGEPGVGCHYLIGGATAPCSSCTGAGPTHRARPSASTGLL